jgi:hypothetical protein
MALTDRQMYPDMNTYLVCTGVDVQWTCHVSIVYVTFKSIKF